MKALNSSLLLPFFDAKKELHESSIEIEKYMLSRQYDNREPDKDSINSLIN